MPARADKEYLRILEMAALIGEELVAACLREFFETGMEISAEKVFVRLHRQRTLWLEPTRLIAPIVVELSVYDSLLGNNIEEICGG